MYVRRLEFSCDFNTFLVVPTLVKNRYDSHRYIGMYVRRLEFSCDFNTFLVLPTLVDQELIRSRSGVDILPCLNFELSKKSFVCFNRIARDFGLKGLSGLFIFKQIKRLKSVIFDMLYFIMDYSFTAQ